MRSNRFGIAVIIQSVLLALTGATVVIILKGDYMVITKASFVILWGLQIFILIWYVNRTNRELEYFLQSLKYLDKVQLTGSGKSFTRLNLTYNQIIDIIRTERTIREAEYQYFRDTVEHINTGLISFSDDGKITIINRAAREILRCGNCSNVKQLDMVNPVLPETIHSLVPGRPRLISVQIEGKIRKLSLNLAMLKIQDDIVKLISVTDIKGELEEGELEAWQKLIRVLTHEIVNSVTPINTLTNAMISQLKKAGLPESEYTRNLSSGIQAIRKRNKGLLSFVENFRRINKVPEPIFRTIKIEELFGNLQSLIQEEFKKAELEFTIADGFSLEADEELIIQVLINLLKNAVEAGAERIVIIARHAKTGRPQILVIDNGPGIEAENLDKIFIPFFSTKKEGSGIGLSLSRQIMRLHRGDISIDADDSTGSTFALTF